MAEKTKTIGVKNIFAWIFSVLFIVSGIGTLFSSTLSGIFLFLAGLIILPPFNKMLEDKAKLKLTTWLKVIIVLVLLVFSGMATSDESSNNINQGNLALADNSNNQNTQTTTPTQTTQPAPTYQCADNTIVSNPSDCPKVETKETEDTTPTQTAPPVEEESDTATMGEKNALNSALSYLGYSAFSYSGLIEQLEFEGYSHNEAVYAADNCGADWNEQDALSAQSYLDYSAFSREGLIEQLEFEGYTRAQAEYGVDAVGY